MSKNYIVTFGTGNPTLNTGLAPTFVRWSTVPGGATSTPPGITEIPTSSGLYYFTFGPTNTVAFVIDGATTGLVAANRYIQGAVDPIDAVDEQLASVGNSMIQGFSGLGSTMIAGFSGLGSTMIAGFSGLGSTMAAGFSSFAASFGIISSLIGDNTSSFGNTAVDPTTLFGYVKRLREFNEGDSDFDKTTGIWDVYSRGASTELVQKALVDAAGTVTKT